MEVAQWLNEHVALTSSKDYVQELTTDFITQNFLLLNSSIRALDENALLVFKLLRNLCVNRSHADTLRDSGLLSALVTCISHVLDSASSMSRTQILNLLFFAFQAIATSVTSNEVSQMFILKNHAQFYGNDLNACLKFANGNKKLIEVISVCLFNSMVHNRDIRLYIWNNNQLLLADLAAQGPTEYEFEWIVFIFTNYFKTELISQESEVHTSFPKFISSYLLHPTDEVVTQRCLHFLEICDTYVSENTMKKEDLTESISESEASVLQALANGALQIAKFVIDLIVRNERNCISFSQFMQFFICLDIISNATGMDSDIVQNTLATNGVIQLLIKLFEMSPPTKLEDPTRHSLDEPTSEPLFLEARDEQTNETILLNRFVLNQTGIPVTYTLPDSDESDDEEDHVSQPMLLGYHSNLMRILGNMCFNRTENQDLVRTLGGIPYALNHCYSDMKNPLLREWGVFCIRNLTEDNPKNQEEIAKYQVLQVDPRKAKMQEDSADPDSSASASTITIKHSVDGDRSNNYDSDDDGITSTFSINPQQL